MEFPSSLDFVDRAYAHAPQQEPEFRGKKAAASPTKDDVGRVLDMTRRELVDICKTHKQHHGQRCNATSNTLRHLARILKDVERLKESLQRENEQTYSDYIPLERIKDALGEDLVNLILTLCPVSHETVLRLVYMDHFMNLDAIRVLSQSFGAYEPYEP